MNSTGNSIFRSSQVGSPARIGADKKIISAAIPGGLAINAPENNKVENAFSREMNRVAGFGPGMASAIIGNASRRGNSVTVSDAKDPRTILGSVGWGVQNSKLD